MRLHFSSHTTLDPFALSNVDRTGCPTTRHSTIGYVHSLEETLSLGVQKNSMQFLDQHTEVEYCTMANTIAEFLWMSFILNELHIIILSSPILYSDNLSALHMTVNLVFNAWSKHIELDYHFVRERIAHELLVTQHVSSDYQVADLFTKPISKVALHYLHNKLCLRPQ